VTWLIIAALAVPLVLSGLLAATVWLERWLDQPEEDP
jgi:hypothetical protein